MFEKRPKGLRGLAQIHQVAALAEQLTKITHFTLDECKALITLHTRLESQGPLDRLRMREVLHVIFEITDNVMLDLAFRAFDKDEDNYVDDIEFVRGLSTMLRGTTDELSEWCYFIYDMNGDGGLAREELAHCLKGCIVPGYGVDADEAEEGEREIVEIALKKLDVDRGLTFQHYLIDKFYSLKWDIPKLYSAYVFPHLDGQVTLTDFKTAVKRDPLLLVAAGPCLPPVRCCAAFLALITENFRSYTGPLGRAHAPKPSSSKFRFQSTKTMQAPFHNVKTKTELAFMSAPPPPPPEKPPENTAEDSIRKSKALSVSIVGTLTPVSAELMKRPTRF